MKNFTYVISDRQGIHARNAIQLAKVAESFQCSIRIECGNRKADAKNVMSLMGLGAKMEESLHFTLDGEDEEQAFHHLEALVREIL